MSSNAIGYLVSIYSTLTHNEKKIMFAEANSAISDIIGIVGLDQLIHSYKTLEEAKQMA